MNDWLSTRNPSRAGKSQFASIIAFFRLIGIGISLALAAPAQAQTTSQPTARCTVPGDISLSTVVKWIDTLPESRAITDINVCRIGFAMDAAAIDRLNATKATPAIFAVLNKATAMRLTLEEARSQSADLQSHIAVVDASVNKDRDAALAKLDADYQTKQASAAYCKPKSEFETTAQYEARCQEARNSAMALEGKHQEEHRQLIASYTVRAAAKEAPIRNRIAYLQQASYPDLRAAIYGSYDPNNSQLAAKIGNEDYIFENVPGNVAETMVKNWPKIKVKQPMVEDDLHTRILVFESFSIPGYSRAAGIAATQSKNRKNAADAVIEAQTMMDRKDYKDAVAKYQTAVILDPDSQAAKNGLSSAQKAAQGLIDERNNEIRLGEWTDPRTTLMWTARDNGEADMNWKAANAYCQNLRIGDHADWRLPSKNELKNLYDPTAKRDTPPLAKARTYFNYGDPKTDPRGSYWTYHIAGGIQLSGSSVWSGNIDYSEGLKNMYYYVFFPDGTVASGSAGFTRQMRALCVRDTDPKRKTDLASQQEPKPARDPLDVQVFQETLQNCNAGNAEQCEMTGYHYEKGVGVDKDIQKAIEAYQRGCTLGQRGCVQARYLINKLAKQQ